jgi:hypothetical protein
MNVLGAIYVPGFDLEQHRALNLARIGIIAKLL